MMALGSVGKEIRLATGMASDEQAIRTNGIPRISSSPKIRSKPLSLSASGNVFRTKAVPDAARTHRFVMITLAVRAS